MIEDIVNNNGFEYVDLGLPSRTLWATMNIGASKLSDPGLYFQWGDTVGYREDQVGRDKQFTWKDYKWNPSGDDDERTFTKYTNLGDILEPKDDAAHIHMKGSWHMPTSKQILELINNTTNDWITFDGVDGRLFTSKKDKSKIIFIPISGAAVIDLILNSRNFGYIWSSMLSVSHIECSQYLGTYSDGAELSILGYRYDGRPIRGVIG